MKVLVVGPPRTGKTTGSNLIALSYDLPLYHSDVYKELPWDEQKIVVHQLLTSLSGYVFEGCTVARSLNLAHRLQPDVKPCDALFYFTKYLVPRNDLTPGQLGLGTRIRHIMEELLPWLSDRGVRTIVL